MEFRNIVQDKAGEQEQRGQLARSAPVTFCNARTRVLAHRRQQPVLMAESTPKVGICYEIFEYEMTSYLLIYTATRNPRNQILTNVWPVLCLERAFVTSTGHN